MTDDTSFPTTLVPVRPVPLAERWDTLARRIKDPVVTLFTALESPDPEMRFKAAAELMPYRYPKLKASEVNFTGAGGGGPAVAIQINIASPATDRVQVSSVTPPVDPLD
jgi:hypothetical protein